MAQHKPKMVFLTSPNNPDGSMMSDEEVRAQRSCCFFVRHVRSTMQLTSRWHDAYKS